MRPTEITAWTALRGLAALWIVAFHFWPQTSTATPYLVTKGYLAVDLFFVLSGAVMALIYARDIRARRFDLAEFARRRLARLYPVHLVTLIGAVIILGLGPMLGAPARPLPYDLGQMVALQLTLLHAWGLSETGGLNYPSWSIAAEAFAYLLFPLLAVALFRLRALPALILALALLLTSVALVENFWPETLRRPAPELSFTRMENDFGALRIVPEFLLGMALSHAFAATRHRPSGMALAAGGLAMIAWAFGADQDLWFILGAAALLAGLMIWQPRAPRPLRWLGRISYSLYMSHALVQIVGFKLLETLGGWPDGMVPPVFLLGMFPLSLLAGWLLCQLVEIPARNWLIGPALRRQKPRSQPRPARGATVKSTAPRFPPS
jgi:peptidoglycan/LPS O-acetylase OafA/YrhL